MISRGNKENSCPAGERGRKVHPFNKSPWGGHDYQ